MLACNIMIIVIKITKSLILGFTVKSTYSRVFTILRKWKPLWQVRHFELFSNIDCCYVKICTFAIIKNQFSRRWRHLTLSNGRFRSYDSRLRRNGSRMRRRFSSNSGIWSSRRLVTFNHWLGWSWPTSVLVTFLLRNEKSSQTWVHSRKKWISSHSHSLQKIMN